MAVVNKSSAFITNRDASPAVLSNPILAGGLIREATGYVSAANGDSATSVYRMCQVPSNARVSGIVLECEALGTGCTVDVGAYKATANGGAVINSTFFASAIDVHLATARTEVVNQSGSNTLDLQEQPLWQALSLASDPFTMIDICVTVHVATAAAGKIGLKVKYDL